MLVREARVSLVHRVTLRRLVAPAERIVTTSALLALQVTIPPRCLLLVIMLRQLLIEPIRTRLRHHIGLHPGVPGLRPMHRTAMIVQGYQPTLTHAVTQEPALGVVHPDPMPAHSRPHPLQQVQARQHRRTSLLGVMVQPDQLILLMRLRFLRPALAPRRHRRNLVIVQPDQLILPMRLLFLRPALAARRHRRNLLGLIARLDLLIFQVSQHHLGQLSLGMIWLAVIFTGMKR